MRKKSGETIGHLAESRTLIIISHPHVSVQNAKTAFAERWQGGPTMGTHEALMAEGTLQRVGWYASGQWRWQNEAKIQLFDEKR